MKTVTIFIMRSILVLFMASATTGSASNYQAYKNIILLVTEFLCKYFIVFTHTMRFITNNLSQYGWFQNAIREPCVFY
jgi:hypothetical protein